MYREDEISVYPWFFHSLRRYHREVTKVIRRRGVTLKDCITVIHFERPRSVLPFTLMQMRYANGPIQ